MTARHVPFLLLLALPACGDQPAAAAGSPNLFEVVRRDMQITIKENAELQALRETYVRSELEGQATIISIVPEGSTVKQGDKLVELDSSELIDKRDNQGITVAKAEAALAQAAKSLEILQKELVAKRTTAESGLLISQMELEKFLGRPKGEQAGSQGRNGDMVQKLRDLVSSAPPVAQAGDEGQTGTRIITQVDPRNFAALVDKARELLQISPKTAALLRGGEQAAGDPLERDMGEMANKILQQVDQIRLAMADLKVKEDTFRHSQRLAAKQFITRNELEGHDLAFQSQMSKVTLAWNDLDLLINYTLSKERIELTQKVENAALELERVLASNQAEETKADSEMKSKQLEYNLAKGRLDNLEKQIRNAKIYAPTPGLVVYARLERDRRSSESVREGISVRERQDLIILPDTTRMTAVVKVQEAVIDQVAVGQRALVSVEAFPDRTFTGRVTRVAPVADSNSGWMSSDRKVYTTVVELDGENPESQLRSRMAAGVTILVDEVKDALIVPLQAVRRDRSVNYVWLQTPGGPVATPVDVGRHNAEHVSIQTGVKAGDKVYLAPPLGAPTPDLPQPPTPAPLLTEEKPAAAGNPTPGENPATAGNTPGGENGGRRPGRGQGGGQGGMPGMSEEMQQQMAAMRVTNEAIRAWLEQKYPDRQEEIADRRQRSAMLAEPDVQAALKAEQPDLAAKYEEGQRLMQQFRGQGGGGRGPGGGQGAGPGGGERGGNPR